MRIDTFMVGLVFFSLFIVVGVLIIEDGISEYELNITTDEFSDVYDTAGDMYDIGKGMKEDVLEGEIEGGDESWESMTKGGYGAISFFRNTFSIFGQILEAFAKQIGFGDDSEISNVFTLTFTIILTILGIFAIIYMVFRFQPR
jgi:hypothetical protein